MSPKCLSRDATSAGGLFCVFSYVAALLDLPLVQTRA